MLGARVNISSLNPHYYHKTDNFLCLFILPNGIESLEKLGNLVKASKWLSQNFEPKLQELVQIYDWMLLNSQIILQRDSKF